MNTLRKKRYLLMPLLISLFLTGCSKSKADTVFEGTPTGTLMYVSRFVNTAIPKDAIMGFSVQMQDGRCYFQSVSWDETFKERKALYYKQDIIADKEPELLMEDMPGGREIVIAFPNRENGFYTLESELADDKECFYLCRHAEKETEERKLEGEFPNLTTALYGMEGSDGYFSLMVSGGSILQFDYGGKLVYLYQLPEQGTSYFVDDGKGVYVVTEGKSGTALYLLDGSPLDSPELKLQAEEGFRAPRMENGSDGKLFMHNESGLFQVSMPDGHAEELLQWDSEYINVVWDNIQGVSQMADGSFLVLLAPSLDNGVEAAVLYQIDEGLIPEKQVITLGVGDSNRKSYDRLISGFNRQSLSYCVEIKDYHREEDESLHYSDQRLYEDLLTGKAPDLIDLTYAAVEDLTDKGVLEDLEPYFKQSETVNQRDILKNVWDAWKVNGKLVQVFPEFGVGILVAGDVLNDWEDGYTMEQVMEWCEKHPELDFDEYMDMYSLLRFCLLEDMGQFVDFKSGKCYFEEAEFKNRLLFLKGLDLKQPDYDMERQRKRFLQGEYLFYHASFYSMEDYAALINRVGSGVQYTGYPQAEGKLATRLLINYALGMNSASGCKDGAWAFLEYMLSEESQGTPYPGKGAFPVTEKALAEYLETSYMGYGVEGLTRSVPMADGEERAVAERLIKAGRYANTMPGSSKEEKTGRIIMEETQAFLQSGKTVEETAGIIQSRVSILLNE